MAPFTAAAAAACVAGALLGSLPGAEGRLRRYRHTWWRCEHEDSAGNLDEFGATGELDFEASGVVQRRLGETGLLGSSSDLKVFLGEFLDRNHRLEALAFSPDASEWVAFLAGDEDEDEDNGEDTLFTDPSLDEVDAFIEAENEAGKSITSLAFGDGEWFAWTNGAEFIEGETDFNSTDGASFVYAAYQNAKQGCFPTSFAVDDEGNFKGVCRPKPAGIEGVRWMVARTITSLNSKLFEFIQSRTLMGFTLEALVFGNGHWIAYLEAVPEGVAPELVAYARFASATDTQAFIEAASDQGYGHVSALAFGNGQFFAVLRPEVDLGEVVGPGVPTPSPSSTPSSAPTTAPSLSPTLSPVALPPAATNWISVEYTTAMRVAMSAEMQAAFDEGLAMWNKIILDAPTDFPLGQQLTNLQATCGVDFPLGTDFVVSGLLIVVENVGIDGRGGVLAQAGPCLTLSGAALKTLVGVMKFDVADLEALLGDDLLEKVVAHEIGHILGIGTLWEEFEFVSGLLTADPRYNGAGAVSGQQGLGLGDDTIALANTGASGTFGSHWREATFGEELMTGFASGDSLLSIMTVRAAADLGFEVDESLAEAYTIPSLAVFSAQTKAPPVQLLNDVLEFENGVTQLDPIATDNDVPSAATVAAVSGDVAALALVALVAVVTVVVVRHLRRNSQQPLEGPVPVPDHAAKAPPTLIIS